MLLSFKLYLCPCETVVKTQLWNVCAFWRRPWWLHPLPLCWKTRDTFFLTQMTFSIKNLSLLQIHCNIQSLNWTTGTSQEIVVCAHLLHNYRRVFFFSENIKTCINESNTYTVWKWNKQCANKAIEHCVQLNIFLKTTNSSVTQCLSVNYNSTHCSPVQNKPEKWLSFDCTFLVRFSSTTQLMYTN